MPVPPVEAKGPVMMPHSPTHETATLSDEHRVTSEELIERALKIPGLRESVEEHRTSRPTSYKDETPPALTTGAQPVPQPDSRLAPQWATGIAVAGTGIGLMSVGIGLGAKLVFDSVTTEGVVMVSVIVGGAVVFVGVLARLARRVKEAVAAAPAPVTNNFSGDVKIEKNTLVQNDGRAFSFQRNRVIDGGN